VAQVQSHRPWKSEQLRDQLASGGGTIAEIRQIAIGLGVYQDRYLARPAAEMLIAQGAPGAERMAATLATMPITGKDYKGDLLRGAFKAALAKEGIAPDVERVARAFYEHRKGAQIGDGGGGGMPAGSQSAAAPPSEQSPAYPPDRSNPPPAGVGDMIRSVLRSLGMR
jgi:hypothetical protein